MALRSSILMVTYDYLLQLWMLLYPAIPGWVDAIGDVFHNTAVAIAITTISAVFGLTINTELSSLSYVGATLIILYALCFSISVTLILISILFDHSLKLFHIILVGINLNLLLFAFVVHMTILLPQIKDLTAPAAFSFLGFDSSASSSSEL
ncbi:hypothetical protein AMTRI_Chr11g150780 [Amborella trichopoda]|uniref:uncharacterized protein LOC110007871 n=1 Tax=Amborella trichopoda TaxID=13333 RepID=UPI0009C163E1|nr:uncharacterized protein LOC110007871 [Amborella trichopoda]|eukprot:XP_020527410.1 uncharacterized protein LOC110007871 [Amborella trichopoda]